MNDRKTTILVADDQENMRTILARVLSLEGFAYHIAASGKSAIEILDNRPVDLALLDINMPGIDGIGVVEHMKSSAALARIPVIMLTGQADIASVMRCKALGVDDYLSKPYKISALLTRIAHALQPREDTP